MRRSCMRRAVPLVPNAGSCSTSQNTAALRLSRKARPHVGMQRTSRPRGRTTRVQHPGSVRLLPQQRESALWGSTRAWSPRAGSTLSFLLFVVLDRRMLIHEPTILRGAAGTSPQDVRYSRATLRASNATSPPKEETMQKLRRWPTATALCQRRVATRACGSGTLCARARLFDREAP